MAGGEARVTGCPAICLATEGPGALNLVNGVADAWRDGLPMLIITGQVDTAKISSNVKQYFNQQALFAPITGSTTLLTRPESTMAVFTAALERAVGDRLPCHVAVPADIFTTPAAYGPAGSPAQPAPPPVYGDFAGATRVLQSSQRPILLAGRVAVPHREKVWHLADRLGAGIIPGQGARAIFPGAAELVIGGLGEAHIPPLLTEADCVILVGASPYEEKFIPAGVQVVQVDLRPQNIAHSLRPLPLTGDVGLLLERLLQDLPRTRPAEVWRTKIANCHRDYRAMIGAEAGLSGKPIPPPRVVAVLNDILPEDAVITIDSGEFMHWFDRGFIAKRQEVLISENWRCMGCALPFGLGAQLANPRRKVVVLTGDGGFLMTMPEILTAVRYALPVSIIIFNNGGYALEKHRMENKGWPPFGVDVQQPDFVSPAKACGATGLRVEEPADLGDVLKGAIAADHPVVVDVPVSADKPLFLA